LWVAFLETVVMHTHDAIPPLQPRRFLAEYRDDTPRHWCGGNAAVTHILNAYTLLVPGNEGFFIRTLKQALPRFEDPSIREMIMHFSHQEGQHGAGHVRFWTILEKQGYRIRGFQRKVDFLLYRIIERITPFRLRLSIVACIEHINAYIGHEFLKQDILRDAEPALRALFEWHFAEEIEHKSVSYDVLQRLAPGYATRLIGALMVVPLFYLLSTCGALFLLHQDKLLLKAGTWRALRDHLGRQHHMARRTLGHLRNYLRPGFHPSQLHDDVLAKAVLDHYSSPQSRMIEPISQAA
jgi:predicted metal-dependent hydrolase